MSSIHVWNCQRTNWLFLFVCLFFKDSPWLMRKQTEDQGAWSVGSLASLCAQCNSGTGLTAAGWCAAATRQQSVQPHLGGLCNLHTCLYREWKSRYSCIISIIITFNSIHFIVIPTVKVVRKDKRQKLRKSKVNIRSHAGGGGGGSGGSSWCHCPILSG